MLGTAAHIVLGDQIPSFRRGEGLTPIATKGSFLVLVISTLAGSLSVPYLHKDVVPSIVSNVRGSICVDGKILTLFKFTLAAEPLNNTT